MRKTLGSEQGLYVYATDDGSPSVFHSLLNEGYHSKYGAITESHHVFIQQGLKSLAIGENIHLLEVGFGTGLNALLTLCHVPKHTTIYYTAIEPSPLSKEIISQFHFSIEENKDVNGYFKPLHDAPWDTDLTVITAHFFLKKRQTDLQSFIAPANTFDLIYYDAFAPQVQPEMWTIPVFQSLFSMMKPGGICVTYCAKGEVRRNMQAVGLIVERLPGPPGKREMLRASKPILFATDKNPIK